jgi:hypothetical protein
MRDENEKCTRGSVQRLPHHRAQQMVGNDLARNLLLLILQKYESDHRDVKRECCD